MVGRTTWVLRRRLGLPLRATGLSDFFQPLRDSLLDSATGGKVVPPARQRRRQALHIRQSVFEFVRVLVALAVSPLLHGAGHRVAQLHRHRLRDGLAHVREDAVQGLVRGVRLRRHRQVDGGLRQRLIALRSPQEMDRLHRGDGLFERPRLGQADILDGYADQGAPDVKPVLAACEHAPQPVERRVHVARADRFVQRRNQVEVLLAGLVVEQHLALDRILHRLVRKLLVLGRRHRRLERVVGGARIAVGEDGNLLEQLVRGANLQVAEAVLAVVQRPPQQGHDLGHCEPAQRVHLGARQQRRDDFEGRILGGGADEGDVAALDIGQEGVLLRLVEAVDLVDEQQRAAPELAVALGLGHDGLDFLDAAEHGAEGDEIGPRDAGDEAGQRGLADAGRSPQNDRAELAAFDLRAQRLRRAEDVLLAAEVLKAIRAHALGERTALVHSGSCLGRRRGVVEEAHGGSLWRRASYNRIAAAVAALRDSTPRVGMRRPAAPALHSSLTPRPSLPITKAHPRLRPAWSRFFEAEGAAAYTSSPCAWSAARAGAASSPVSSGTRKTEPADARTAFGLYGLTVPFRKIRPVAPKASAVRMIAPALPGSCTPSRTTTSGWPVNSRSSSHSGGRTSAMTPCAVSVSDRDRNRASASTSRRVWGRRRSSVSTADCTGSAASTAPMSQPLASASSSR